MAKELFQFRSPTSSIWRVVFDGSKYYIERHSIDALGGVVWIPEANFEASIINQNWIAALVVTYANELASKKVTSPVPVKRIDVDEDVPF